MSSPAIVGAYDGTADAGGASCLELAADAALCAIADAGLGLDTVDAVMAVHSWEEPSMMFASHLADYLGLRPSLVETAAFGGASPVMMVGRAAQALSEGRCDVVVLAASSNRASGLGRDAAIRGLRDVLDPEFEAPTGAFIPTLYALAAQRHVHDYGTTREQLAAVAATQRAYASLHPSAVQRTPLSIEEVLAAPIVSSPLSVRDCCLITDFRGALVLTRAEHVASARLPPVWVVGYGEAHRPITATAPDVELTSRGAQISGTQALTASGLTIDDIDFAELYDSFTITVLITLEDLGFCRRGEAGPLALDGAFAVGGELPVNTNGGMLSYRTGGMSHLIEAVAQLRGSPAGARVESPSVGLVHGIGGVFSTHATVILSNEDVSAC